VNLTIWKRSETEAAPKGLDLSEGEYIFTFALQLPRRFSLGVPPKHKPYDLKALEMELNSKFVRAFEVFGKPISIAEYTVEPMPPGTMSLIRRVILPLHDQLIVKIRLIILKNPIPVLAVIAAIGVVGIIGLLSVLSIERTIKAVKPAVAIGAFVMIIVLVIVARTFFVGGVKI